MSFPFLDNLDFLEMPQFCSLFYRAICCTCWLLLLGLENFTQLHVLLHFLFPRPAHLHSCDENECEHFSFHPSRVKEVGRIFFGAGKENLNVFIRIIFFFLSGVESGVAIGDTHPVPPCFTDLTEK